jgi:hypothetical protein
MMMMTVVAQMMVHRHHRLSSTCSRDKYGSGGSMDNIKSALLVIPPLLPCTTMAAVVVLMRLPLHIWQSVACLRNDGCGSGADDGALASSAVRCLLMQQRRQQQCG